MCFVPESVELREGLVHLLGRAGGKRHSGADLLQLGFQGLDARFQGCGLSRA